MRVYYVKFSNSGLVGLHSKSIEDAKKEATYAAEAYDGGVWLMLAKTDTPLLERRVETDNSGKKITQWKEIDSE